MNRISGWKRLLIVMNGIWVVLAAIGAVRLNHENPTIPVGALIFIYIISFAAPNSLWLLIRSVAWVIEGFRSKD